MSKTVQSYAINLTFLNNLVLKTYLTQLTVNKWIMTNHNLKRLICDSFSAPLCLYVIIFPFSGYFFFTWKIKTNAFFEKKKCLLHCLISRRIIWMRWCLVNLMCQCSELIVGLMQQIKFTAKRLKIYGMLFSTYEKCMLMKYFKLYWNTLNYIETRWSILNHAEIMLNDWRKYNQVFSISI